MNILLNESVFAVSYDVYGYENEIETYLFSEQQVDKEKTCQLREDFEMIMTNQCNEETDKEGVSLSFKEWVEEKGIWCEKISQYRVEPTEVGQSKDYSIISLDN